MRLLANKTWRRILVAAFLLWPWFVTEQPWSFQAVRAAFLVLAVLSVVLLTGWVGQVSLAQGALMGVGAFSAARVTVHLGIDFPFSAIVAGAAAALAAVMIGVAALRIRGLYLAITTLAFQWMMEASLLQWHTFSGGFNGVVIDPLQMDVYDFSSERLFYYLAWPITILALLLVANLRDSKTGRAWFAIRGSEVAAQTLGISVVRYKLLAFAVSGFIVGTAGALQLNFVGSATPTQFVFQTSILLVAVAVVGGVNQIGGAVIGGILFTISDYIFSTTPALRGKIDIVAAALLIWTLLQNPDGVIAAREHIKERIAAKRLKEQLRRQRTGEVTADRPTTEPAEIDLAQPLLVGAGHRPVSGGQDPTPEPPPPPQRKARAARTEAPVTLRADEITVRFGGVVANGGLSLEVRTGEICGLIGPNGAGKTTFFNTVNGLIVPNAGRVRLNDIDITAAPVHARAALGMARTFQIMKLFPRLTVLQNLMVATHLQNTSSFTENLFMLQRSREGDERNRERALEILRFLGIADVAEQKVADLPFGTLRMVELGRSLIMQPKLLLLDEPSSGLDVAETEAMSEILLRVRDEMNLSVLIIEHDMSLVMSISDYVYVLDFGRNLAEGLPAEIQANQTVISAYLGEEAIA